MSIENLTALVTGCSGGIGREIALSLAKEKVQVVLFGGTNKEKLFETEKLIKEMGGKCFVIGGNLCDEKVLNACFESAINQVGKIDILINNAGLAHHHELQNTPTEVYDNIMNINVKVPFLLIQKCLPYLKKSSRATIINVASVVAHVGYPFQSVYTASKHALLGLSKSLANEVYQDGVRVHVISPGGVYTDMIKISRPDLTGEGMITTSEIAEVILFLLKNRGNAVIDEIILHRVNKPPFLA